MIFSWFPIRLQAKSKIPSSTIRSRPHSPPTYPTWAPVILRRLHLSMPWGLLFAPATLTSSHTPGPDVLMDLGNAVPTHHTGLPQYQLPEQSPLNSYCDIATFSLLLSHQEPFLRFACILGTACNFTLNLSLLSLPWQFGYATVVATLPSSFCCLKLSISDCQTQANMYDLVQLHGEYPGSKCQLSSEND